MKAFGVQIAGEKQLRKVSKEAIGENLAGEATPFYFSGKPGIDIQLAPHVFVPDLVYIPVFFTELDIDEFLAHYRFAFPTASITPKLHMVEDHIVDFLRQWKVGIGMLGEQGAESIHTTFNQLERTYSNMPNDVQRLKSMVTEHYRQICPDNIIRCPPPAKRKKIVEALA